MTESAKDSGHYLKPKNRRFELKIEKIRRNFDLHKKKFQKIEIQIKQSGEPGQSQAMIELSDNL